MRQKFAKTLKIFCPVLGAENYHILDVPWTTSGNGVRAGSSGNKRRRARWRHVPLDGDGDDEPDAEVADGVGDDARQFADPVGLRHQLVAGQLRDPEP